MTTEQTDSLPTVQTRQVTVQVLTIGAKQVTQAMYRQIPEWDIIDESTGKLDGLPWGWVNLHSGCEEDRAHYHVIWESHGKLHKCTFKKSMSFSARNNLKTMIAQLLEIYASFVGLAGGELPLKKYGSFSASLDNQTVESPILRSSLQELLRGSKNPDAREDVEHSLQKDIEKFQRNGLSCSNQQETRESMKILVDKLNEVEGNYSDSLKTIEDAGQLFIAVSGVWK